MKLRRKRKIEPDGENPPFKNFKRDIHEIEVLKNTNAIELNE